MNNCLCELVLGVPMSKKILTIREKTIFDGIFIKYILKSIFSIWFKLAGWTVTKTSPQGAGVAIAAPHTSNWDFVIGIAAKLSLNLHIHFLGKDAIFIWPFKGMLKRQGGIAIDRKHRHGVVEQMVKKFSETDQLLLAIAPEGTRSKTKQWKTGFLHIAHLANVPVVAVSLDFAAKEIFFHSETYIESDISQELIRFKQFYVDVCAKNPQAV